MRQAIVKGVTVVNICVGEAGGITIPDNSQVTMGWTYSGGVFAAPVPEPAELAAISQRIADATEKAEAKADATTQYLVTHTLLEINTFVRNKINTPAVTNLATATTSLKEMETLLIKLAAVVSVLAKDKLR